MLTVLVVDDERNIRDLIKIYLRNEHFRVLEAANGAAAWSILEKESIDLVVLDVMMPVMNGWDLCKNIKEHYDIPVLIVTAQGEAEQRIRGFRIGTDDYVVKPFDPQELVLRIKALLKRFNISSSQTVKVSNLVINRNTYEIFVGNERLVLPLKEFELLFKLANYADQVFTRTQLIEQIWGNDYEGDERTVDVHIKRLRERIAEKTNQIRIITVRGIGYRFEASHV